MRIHNSFAHSFVVLTEPYCGKEWSECTCYGNVTFGQDTRWSEPKETNGTIMCTKDVFGDPAPGATKRCICNLKGKYFLSRSPSRKTKN